MNVFCRVMIGTVACAFGVVGNAAAQECLGISPGTRAYASYGVEGTDGITGQALTVGFRASDFTVQLHGRLMEPNALVLTPGGGKSARDMKTVQLQLAYPITKKLPLCVFGGLGWTNYDLQTRASFPNEGFV